MESDNKKSSMDEYKEVDTVGLTEKVEIISTEDEKIKSVGELLSADSSRTILKLLFDEVMTANQIAQKTGISLPLVIYHLKKMQEMGIVKITAVGKNVKAQDMKYYTSTKFAIVILPSSLSEKAKTSKSLANSFKTIYRIASIGVAAVATWFISQMAQNTRPNLNANVPAPTNTLQQAYKGAGPAASSAPTTAPAVTSGGQAIPVPAPGPESVPAMTPVAPTGMEITVDIFWSIIITLSVVIVGLIIERILRARKH